MSDPMSTPKILIVDDDAAIRDMLTAALEERFQIVIAGDARAAEYQLATEQPDLVLLDLVLPDMDGLLLIYRIRATGSGVPIIVLSARHNQTDRCIALKAGADDFIDKPFDLDDLDARVDAVLRRCAREQVESLPGPAQFGALRISATRGVRMGSRVLHLSPNEHTVLTALATAGGRVVSRAALAEHLWHMPGPDARLERMAIAMTIYRLRGRLRLSRATVAIRAETGRGYFLVDELASP